MGGAERCPRSGEVSDLSPSGRSRRDRRHYDRPPSGLEPQRQFGAKSPPGDGRKSPRRALGERPEFRGVTARHSPGARHPLSPSGDEGRRDRGMGRKEDQHNPERDRSREREGACDADRKREAVADGEGHPEAASRPSRRSPSMRTRPLAVMAAAEGAGAGGGPVRAQARRWRTGSACGPIARTRPAGAPAPAAATTWCASRSAGTS